MAKYKYYVVWEGRARGIFDSWEECKEQVDNFKGAKYKSFDSLEAATEAFRNAPDDYFDVMRKIGEHSRDKLSAPILPPSVIADSLSVDAACSGNPGKMEYRGVDTKSGIELFHVGPLEQGTNNIGEFLALVHGLAYLQQRDSDIPIYSDSRNAILWIKQKKCKTKLAPNAANAPIFDLIARALRIFLKSSTVRIPPPTVNGINTCFATASTISTTVSRASDDAVMSRKTSSSAPALS